MLTRSLAIKKTMQNDLSVNIDFDEASIEWNRNKTKLENGTYKYICGFKCKNGNQCKKKPLPNTDICNIHFKKCLIPNV